MFNRGPKVSFVCSRALHQVTARDSRARHNVSGCRDVQVHVFDLAENKHEAMCDQKVVRKSKLTHIAFNPDPESAVVLVSDDGDHFQDKIIKLEEDKSSLHTNRFVTFGIGVLLLLLLLVVLLQGMTLL